MYRGRGFVYVELCILGVGLVHLSGGGGRRRLRFSLHEFFVVVLFVACVFFFLVSDNR